MTDSDNNGRKRFFSPQHVDFDDDSAIEEFAWKVWEQIARQETGDSMATHTELTTDPRSKESGA